jgi:transposase
MMGHQQGGQEKLFYAFNLDEQIPQDHLLRQIDQFLELGELRQHLSTFYSHTGRPSVDPELMMRMLIVGYCFGIRSERRLCEEVHLNLAYRWFCRLGLEERVPDHSTFSKNRHGRFRDSGALRKLFETVLRGCMRAGLVGGEGFATDASIIKADAQKQRGVPGDAAIDWGAPEEMSRPVREYLAALEHSYQPQKPPKAVSLTDPAATWTAAGGPAIFAYSANYLIDLKANIIVDVEASSVNKVTEVAATRAMMERVEACFELKPERLVADTNYGTADMLGWLVEDKHITPHIPVWDKSDGKAELFGRSDFLWDANDDCYYCPQGKPLRARSRNFKNQRSVVTKANTIIYRASQRNCQSCRLKAQCCPNTPARKIHRSIHEDARDVARALAHTQAYARSRNERKKVEMLFAHLKRILKLDRLRLRGPSGANDEFLLAATAQNLRRAAKLLGRPPPEGRVVVPA